MAVWSTTTVAEAVESGRFDADFFRPEFLAAAARLRKAKNDSVLRHFRVSDGNHSTISHAFAVGPDTVPYYRGQDLNGFFLENAAPLRIPTVVYSSARMRRSHFASEDVLVCIVGANTGTTSFVTDAILPSTGSCKIGIIRALTASRVDSAVLAAFMLGRYGQIQIAQHKRGTAQGGLILKDILKLRVPLLDDRAQRDIRHALETAIGENRRAIAFRQQATATFEKALHAPATSDGSDRRYSSRFSEVSIRDIVATRRIDSQCYSPNALLYDRWLRQKGHCEQLSALVATPIKGRQQAETEAGSVPYCSIKHLTHSEVQGASLCSPSPGSPVAAKDDLLLAITGATIGKVGIIKRYAELAYSGDLIRLRTTGSIDPHYLLVGLSHSVGQTQFNRWITGSTNGHLAPRDIGRALVPRLGHKLEENIASLMEKSIASRSTSEGMLTTAVQLVEELIDRGAAA